jgi:hypothetical protein
MQTANKPAWILPQDGPFLFIILLSGMGFSHLSFFSLLQTNQLPLGKPLPFPRLFQLSFGRSLAAGKKNIQCAEFVNLAMLPHGRAGPPTVIG